MSQEVSHSNIQDIAFRGSLILLTSAGLGTLAKLGADYAEAKKQYYHTSFSSDGLLSKDDFDLGKSVKIEILDGKSIGEAEEVRLFATSPADVPDKLANTASFIVNFGPKPELKFSDGIPRKISPLIYEDPETKNTVLGVQVDGDLEKSANRLEDKPDLIRAAREETIIITPSNQPERKKFFNNPLLQPNFIENLRSLKKIISMTFFKPPNQYNGSEVKFTKNDLEKNPQLAQKLAELFAKMFQASLVNQKPLP